MRVIACIAACMVSTTALAAAPQQQSPRIRTITWAPSAVPEIRATVGSAISIEFSASEKVTDVWSSSISDLTKPDYADHAVILKPKHATPLTPLFVRTEREGGTERVYPFAFEAVENADAPYVVRITNPADAVAAQRAAWARRQSALEQQRAQAALAAAASMPSRNSNYTIQAGK